MLLGKEEEEDVCHVDLCGGDCMGRVQSVFSAV